MNHIVKVNKIKKKTYKYINIKIKTSIALKNNLIFIHLFLESTFVQKSSVIIFDLDD